MMQATFKFLILHGYLVLFGLVLMEQLGLPLPSFPVLLAAGALAGSGKLDLKALFAFTVIAALLADLAWFVIGRKRGNTVLRWLCRISLEPDSCVRSTEDIYVRHGASSLLVAKFVPGVNAVAAPVAGIFRMQPMKFLFFDSCGVLLWAGCYISLGYYFASELEAVAEYALRLGQLLTVLLVFALGVYIAAKYRQRMAFIRDLNVARITPMELKRMLDAKEPVQIVDLRNSLDYEAEPVTLPGAKHFDPIEIDRLIPEISLDRDVILYCT